MTPPEGGKGSKEVSTSRQTAIKNVQSLSFERRVRKELREQGILDGDEAPKVILVVGILGIFERDVELMDFFFF